MIIILRGSLIKPVKTLSLKLMVSGIPLILPDRGTRSLRTKSRLLIERILAKILISPVQIILNVSCKWGLIVRIKAGIVDIKWILKVLVVWHLPVVPHFETQFIVNSPNSRKKSQFNHSLHQPSRDISQTTKRLETRHFAVVAGEAP